MSKSQKSLSSPAPTATDNFQKSQLHTLTEADTTQGYDRSGVAVCPNCLQSIRYVALTLEDEDLED